MYHPPEVLTNVGLSFLTQRTNRHTYDIIIPRKKKWTLEALQLEALKYDTRLAFQKGSKSAYSQAQKQGMIGTVCRHMPKPPTQLTDSELYEDAVRYKTKREYYTSSRYYFEVSKRGLLKDFYNRMKEENSQ